MTEHSASKREVEQEAEEDPGSSRPSEEADCRAWAAHGWATGRLQGAPGEMPVARFQWPVPLRAVETQCRGPHCVPRLERCLWSACPVVFAKHGCFCHLRSGPKGGENSAWNTSIQQSPVSPKMPVPCLFVGGAHLCSKQGSCRRCLPLNSPCPSAASALLFSTESCHNSLACLPFLPAWNVPPVLLLSESHLPWITQVPSSP